VTIAGRAKARVGKENQNILPTLVRKKNQTTTSKNKRFIYVEKLG
jgi:hypothetical protein